MKNQKNYYEIVKAYKVREAILDGEYYRSNPIEHMDRSKQNNNNIDVIETQLLKPYLKRRIYLKKCPINYFIYYLMSCIEHRDMATILNEKDFENALLDFDQLELKDIDKHYKLSKMDQRLLYEWNQLKYLPVYVSKFIEENGIHIHSAEGCINAVASEEKLKPILFQAEQE